MTQKVYITPPTELKTSTIDMGESAFSPSIEWPRKFKSTSVGFPSTNPTLIYFVLKESSGWTKPHIVALTKMQRAHSVKESEKCVVTSQQHIIPKKRSSLNRTTMLRDPAWMNTKNSIASKFQGRMIPRTMIVKMTVKAIVVRVY